MEADVTITKRSGAPIEVTVTAKGMGVSMGLAEFLTALAEEVGNPALVMTVAALESRMQRSAGAVLHRMKQQTKRL